MGTLIAALTELNTFLPGGFTVALGYGSLQPPAVSRLPALITQIETAENRAALFAPANIGNTDGLLTMYLDQIALISSPGLGNGTQGNAATLLDNYTQQIDWMMNNQLFQPLSLVLVDLGVQRYRQTLYYGWRVTHRWIIRTT